jgi:nucleoside recognition membrane protein YjiH
LQFSEKKVVPMAVQKTSSQSGALPKFLIFSLFGVFMFFFNLQWLSPSLKSVPVDFIVTSLQKYCMPAVQIFILAVMYVGAIRPFYTKTWNKGGMDIFMSFAKIGGAIIGTIMYFGLWKSNTWLWRGDIGPFLFNKLAIPVGLVIPIGSAFLCFLANYGLMEFIGVLVDRFMRPVFHTPGRSAIDAVASFVGSYSIALIITNGVYRENRYTAREAAIIATGFSTVSVTFLLVVARTLGLMDLWSTYFFVSMAVTFVVTAITARLWPLKSIPDTYFSGKKAKEKQEEGTRFQRAWNLGLATAAAQPPVFQLCWQNLKAGLKMALSVIPSITSVGLLGLWLAEFTPLFDYFGYLFYPFFKVFGISQAVMGGKAAALCLPEMFLPSILIKSSGTMLLKFVIAVVSISEILFFSASIPCIMGTDIPLKMRDIIVIWFERVVLSILITVPIGMLMGLPD